MSATATTAISKRIYFADTDAGGVVHHAAYVRWFEEARTEWIHARNGNLQQWQDHGIIFVVARLELAYLAPVHLDETVTVTATLSKRGNTKVTFTQEVWRDDQCVCRATVMLVCVTRTHGRPTRIPAPLQL